MENKTTNPGDAMKNTTPAASITYRNNTERGEKAAARLAHHNTAAAALLDAISASMTAADTNAGWCDVSQASDMVAKLLEIHAAQVNAQTGDRLVLESDGGRELPIVFHPEV